MTEKIQAYYIDNTISCLQQQREIMKNQLNKANEQLAEAIKNNFSYNAKKLAVIINSLITCIKTLEDAIY